MNCRPTSRSRTGFIVACAVICVLGAGAVLAQPDEGDLLEWPRQIDGDQGRIIIYQPQVESFRNDRLEARAAVSVTPAGNSQPIFGAFWFSCRMATDLDTREVTLLEVKVTAAKFPEAQQDMVDRLSRYLEQEIPRWNIVLDLDRLIADLDDDADTAAGEDRLDNDPPEIISTTRSTVLVLIEGDPILADLQGYDLKYVVNSPYYILQDPRSRKYYLKGGDYWFESDDLLGSWKTTTKLPGTVGEVARQIAEEEARQKAERAEAGETPAGDAELGDAGVPEIVVRTRPAELVETYGEPEYAPIPGTDLLYVQNTENDLIMEVATQRFFVLISGRWYASRSLDGGDWTFVPNDRLPADFAKIPADSDMGQVLVSVAGTQEAKEAVLENQIPQTAEVDRKSATVTVAYDGDPEFERCGDQGVAYARNCDKAVLLIDGTYYCCDEAVWFLARGPEGPWEVATEVPETVQSIPPECPVYNVKYVYIYDSTPEVVYVGYTPGYTCSYVYHGCVVYGTGWWYHPWWRTWYYPRPMTWGFRVHYNPVTGWGFSWGVSFGWLHISVGRPWYRGWWGPAGYRYGYRHGYHRGYRHGYHHGARAGFRAGYRAGQAQSNRNLYRKQRPGVAGTGPDRLDRSRDRRRDRQPGGRDRPETAQRTPRKSDRKNDVYADRDGNTYRRNENGSWQKREGNNWSDRGGSGTNRSRQNLERDHRSRDRGNQRAQQNRSGRAGSGRTGRSGGGTRRR